MVRPHAQERCVVRGEGAGRLAHRRAQIECHEVGGRPAVAAGVVGRPEHDDVGRGGVTTGALDTPRTAERGRGRDQLAVITPKKAEQPGVVATAGIFQRRAECSLVTRLRHLAPDGGFRAAGMPRPLTLPDSPRSPPKSVNFSREVSVDGQSSPKVAPLNTSPKAVPTDIDPHHRARPQLMWHRVAAVKLMKWRRADRRPDVKVLAAANLEK